MPACDSSHLIGSKILRGIVGLRLKTVRSVSDPEPVIGCDRCGFRNESSVREFFHCISVIILTLLNDNIALLSKGTRYRHVGGAHVDSLCSLDAGQITGPADKTVAVIGRSGEGDLRALKHRSARGQRCAVCGRGNGTVIAGGEGQGIAGFSCEISGNGRCSGYVECSAVGSVAVVGDSRHGVGTGGDSGDLFRAVSGSDRDSNCLTGQIITGRSAAVVIDRGRAVGHLELIVVRRTACGDRQRSQSAGGGSTDCITIEITSSDLFNINSSCNSIIVLYYKIINPIVTVIRSKPVARIIMRFHFQMSSICNCYRRSCYRKSAIP